MASKAISSDVGLRIAGSNLLLMYKVLLDLPVDYGSRSRSCFQNLCGFSTAGPLCGPALPRVCLPALCASLAPPKS